MNEEQGESLLEQSYHRCRSHPDFMDIFYDAFVASTPMIQEKFKNVDLIYQKKMIQHSVMGMVLAHKDPNNKGPESVLKDVAKSHGETGYQVRDEEYDHWKNTLLDAVKQCDSECDEDILKEWTEIIDSGIAYLIRNRQGV